MSEPSDTQLEMDDVTEEAAPGPAAHEGPDGDGPEGPGLGKAHPDVESADELAMASALESLVFASEKPQSAAQLGKLVGATPGTVKRLLAHAASGYQGRGIELVEVAGGYQFRTVQANAAVVRRLLQQKPVRLTRAQLETLAIIAYRQPVTRPEIDDIRGVDTGSALKVLLERNMLKILGRKDEPGRPLLYGTTTQFLELFGLASLKDLPTLTEFSELSEESRSLFERRMGEPLLDDEEAEADGADGDAEAEASEDVDGGEAEPTEARGDDDGEDDGDDEDEDEDDEDEDWDDEEDEDEDEDEDDREEEETR